MADVVRLMLRVAALAALMVASLWLSWWGIETGRWWLAYGLFWGWLSIPLEKLVVRVWVWWKLRVKAKPHPVLSPELRWFRAKERLYLVVIFGLGVLVVVLTWRRH